MAQVGIKSDRGLKVALRVWKGFLAKGMYDLLPSEDKAFLCLYGRLLDALLIDFKWKAKRSAGNRNRWLGRLEMTLTVRA